MAKDGIHPESHEVVVNTFNADGSKLTFKTMSTFKGDTIDAEVNIHKHPAWKKDTKFEQDSTINRTALKFADRLKAFSDKK